MSDDFEWGDLPADSRRKSKIDWESWPKPQMGTDKKMRYPSKFFQPDGEGDTTKALKNRMDQSWRGWVKKQRTYFEKDGKKFCRTPHFMSRVVLKNELSGVNVARIEDSIVEVEGGN